MYLDSTVPVPEAAGLITFRKKGESTYVYYDVERVYDPVKKYTSVKRLTIGKLAAGDIRTMYPNANFLRLFPETELPESRDQSGRSCCLRSGAVIAINRAVRDLRLREALEPYFEKKELDLILDFSAYSIIEECNAGQHYPSYAFSHPLFADGMKIYSDSSISSFLKGIAKDQTVGFLNEWNRKRNHRERIYISYDSTNKSSQAGDLELVEYGHPKVDSGLPVFNYAIAYDTSNKEPLFYEAYPGSINDVAQFRYVVEKTSAYGYRHIGFILDRGYFSKANMDAMDEKGYSFVLMVKGMASFVRSLVKQVHGTFERKRASYIPSFDLYGTTVKAKLFVSDGKERWFHIYYSLDRENAENSRIEKRLREMKRAMESLSNKQVELPGIYGKYFELIFDEKDGRFLMGIERPSVIEEELELCGYFVIVTSVKMTAAEALRLYKGRDPSEKLFGADKSFLGNCAVRVQSDEAHSSKIFIGFISLIIRSYMYNCIRDEIEKNGKRPNYMTVPSVIRELEKIELSRHMDGVYRLDHAVTRLQREMLKAFGIDVNEVNRMAAQFSSKLK